MKYTNLKTLCLDISYDNGGINRIRDLNQWDIDWNEFVKQYSDHDLSNVENLLSTFSKENVELFFFENDLYDAHMMEDFINKEDYEKITNVLNAWFDQYC